MGVAAARGLLKPVAPWDGWKLRGEKILLQTLMHETFIDVCQMRFTRQIQGLQYLIQDKECDIFRQHWDASEKILMRYLALRQPWVDWDAEVELAEKQKLEQDVKTWEDAFGKLDDPEVQADIERLAAKLRSNESME